MKEFTKLTAFALALVMALGLLAGCGSSNSDNNTPSGDDASGDAAKTKLVVATSPDFPPFESLEGGEVVGIEVDILNKIAEKMGMELDIQQMDFDSVIPGVQAGKFDVGMSGITVTDKRKENVDFSSVYFMAAQAIVVTADSGINGKADLEGKKVSVQTGTTAEEYCMGNGYEVLAFTANNDAAAALTSGKVDAWVVDNEVALAMAPELGLTVLDEAMTSEPYAFAFQKGSELVAPFNEALDALLADGTVEQIFQQYGVTYIAP